MVRNGVDGKLFFAPQKNSRPQEFPKSCLRRRLRRLTPALPGLWVLFGSLALRTFQCSPFHGSAFQCCAYGSLLIFTPTGICNCQYPLGASFHRKARTCWRPRSRHCAPFYGRAGIHALLWVPLPVLKCRQTILPYVPGRRQTTVYAEITYRVTITSAARARRAPRGGQR